jgi:hypothetical protein
MTATFIVIFICFATHGALPMSARLRSDKAPCADSGNFNRLPVERAIRQSLPPVGDHRPRKAACIRLVGI